MSGWIKIPDSWIESDHIEGLAADAVMLHLSALGHCSRQTSDGDLPRRALRRLWPAQDLGAAVAELEAAQEWQPTDDGWHLTNWQTHLLAASEVEHRRAVSRTTSERYRRHKAGDHSMCDRCQAVKRGDASRHTSVTSLVTQRIASPRSASGEEMRGEDAADRQVGADAPHSPPRVWLEGKPKIVDPTPADVRIYINDYDPKGRHAEVIVTPVLELERELAAAQPFNRLAAALAGDIAEPLAQLGERHRCDGSTGDPSEYCDAHHDATVASLDVTIPRDLAAAWFDRLAGAVTELLERTVA